MAKKNKQKKNKKIKRDAVINVTATKATAEASAELSADVATKVAKPSVLTRPIVHLGILALMVAIVYSPTFHVPFYLDDFNQIIENPVIQNSLDLANIANYSTARFIGYLTFSFDQALYGNLPRGFHITNLSIHLLSGWAFYGLLLALIQSPALQNPAFQNQTSSLKWLPLIASLIFVLHPLQTQAVTYIVQRLASLTGMLYISSMAFYAWGRISSMAKISPKISLYLLSFIFAILACFTKQNALTIPAAILLLELLFFQQLSNRQVWHLFIASVIATIVLVVLVNIDPIDQLTRESPFISRSDYFLTQVLVLWRYIGLFLLPVNLRLEYDIALQADWLDPVILVALALHTSLILIAYRFWSKAPILSFGILFFYLTHLIESGFFPITDLMFEHRTYLPNIGLSVLVAAGLLVFLSKTALKPAFLILTPVIIVLASVLTFERNQLWTDQIKFLKAETKLSPNKERAWTSLGKELMRRNQLREASLAFTRALNVAKTDEGLEVRPATLLNAILLHHYLGQFDKAFELQHLLPLDSISAVERSKLHEVRGISFLNLKNTGQAEKEFNESIRNSPNLNAEGGLATVALLHGDEKTAENRARQVLSREPKNILAARVLSELGLTTNR